MTDGHMILCLLFRATFLQIRASAQITTLGSFDSALDGISFELPWYIDSTNSSSDYVVAQLDLPLDDHQLFLSVPTSPQKPIQVELSVDASQPDPRPAFYGVTATQLPLGDIIDDASPQLLYSSDVGWDHRTSGVLGWGGTHSTTYESGSWFQVTFAGSAIWICGDIGVYDAHLNVTVTEYIGNTTSIRSYEHYISRNGRPYPLYRAPWFNETSLPWSLARTYKFTLLSGVMSIDYIRVQGAILDPPTSRPDSSSPYPNRSLLTAWIIVPFVGLLLFGLLLYFLYRKKKRKPTRRRIGTEVKESEAPLRHSFRLEDIDKLERIPRDAKEPLQPTPTWNLRHSSESLATSASQEPSSSRSPFGDNNRDANLPGGLGTPIQLRLNNPFEDLVASQAPTSHLDFEGGPVVVELSHEDLAQVFERARELRVQVSRGSLRLDPGSGEKLDQREILARRLAGIPPVDR